MKGLFFVKPLEFRLESTAEEWRQGGFVEGRLTAANRGSEPMTVQLAVGLAYGRFKRVKTEGAPALTLLEQQSLADELVLAPGKEESRTWRLELAQDCPATGKEGGPFLVYGQRLDQAGGFGHLDLQVALHPLLQTFLTVLETRFIFDLRKLSWSKGWTDLNLKPPANMPSLEELSVKLKLTPETLEAKFACKVAKFGRGASKGVEQVKAESSRSLPLAQCMANASTPNRAYFQTVIREAVEEAAPTAFINR